MLQAADRSDGSGGSLAVALATRNGDDRGGRTTSSCSGTSIDNDDDDDDDNDDERDRQKARLQARKGGRRALCERTSGR